jgi:hypothetical protein
MAGWWRGWGIHSIWHVAAGLSNCMYQIGVDVYLTDSGRVIKVLGCTVAAMCAII